MKTYRVTYTGNAARFLNCEFDVNADCEREAVEKIYSEYCDQNYFPDTDVDGRIRDCDGQIIAEPADNEIEYDGGYFVAELVN